MTVALSTAFLGTSYIFASTEEKPNILWLTFEDTSAAEFGCYGNVDVHTPTVDSLASVGIQYMNAWAVAPQSSPSRSSLITGVYATTYGMDVHAVRQVTPENIFFPQLLRDAGYYCTNNNKTHYNTTLDNNSCWDESDKKASYNSSKRGKNQPFFAVFNTVTSHMGRVRTFHTNGRRDYTKEGIFIDNLTLPSYVPDLPEVRSDYAGHLEAVQDVDKWVSFFLKDLKRKKLDDNTIIFFFSDHGGCLPRGKGYLFESGLKVPFIVYLPEKWKHLAPENAIGTKDYALINFTDLAPTLLNIINEAIPENYQGKPFLGKKDFIEKKAYNFAFASNQLHHFMPVRVASDGHLKYIRSYIPYKQFTLRNYYQWGMPSNLAWDNLWLKGKTKHSVLQQPYDYHPYEMLFNLESDPNELNDLATNPNYKNDLIRFRNALDQHLESTEDAGFIVPSFRKGKNIFDLVHSENYPLIELQQLAAKAANPTKDDVVFIKNHLKNSDPNFRFWAAVGMAQLGLTKQLNKCPKELKKLLSDENPHVIAEAAFACTYLGEPNLGIKTLVEFKNKNKIKIAYSLLECISHDKKMQKNILLFKKQLEEDASNLPHIDNEDAGLMARGILANIGLIDVKDIYKEQYEQGVNLNKGRRPITPLP